MQFAICCRMLYSLLLLLHCRMPYSLLFVAACCTVCYLLPHCRMPYSLPFVAALPHAVQFAICCRTAACRTVCHLLLHCHAIQFAICCCTAACRTVCYLLPHRRMPYSLPFVAACCIVRYLLPHAMRYAVCFLTLYSFSFHCRIPYSFIVATCHTFSYLLQHSCCGIAIFAT